MMNTKFSFKITSIFIIICLVFSSLSGCLAVDSSADDTEQTEYRHIKNTIHNYENYNGGSDSSDYQEPGGSIFRPDDLIPNDSQDNNSPSEDSNEDDLPPDINYDDVVEVPETAIFSEDFENYGEEGTEIANYTLGNGDPLKVTVEKEEAPQGDYCGKFFSTIGDKQYSSVYYNFTTENGEEYDFQNWEKQKYLSFWAKQDGTVRKLILGINDGLNNARATFDVSDKWKFYSIPLTDFVTEDFTITNVKNFHMTWSGGTGSTYIDDIRITENEVKAYQKFIPEGDVNVIENGEYYNGDGLGVKAAYGLIEGEANSTLSVVELDNTEKKSGDYSIKFINKLEENKTVAAFYADLARPMVLSSFNMVSVSLKGSLISGQKVSVMLFDGDTQIAGREFEITSEWGDYIIPITIPEDSLHLRFDRIAVTTPLTSSENIFYLDDLIISNKDGVPETPSNIIENGEYYSDTYTVADAYISDASKNAKTTVSLDNAVKHSGENSVKFSVPSFNGTETTSELLYDFQAKKITKDNHFKVNLNAIGLTAAQNVKFEMLDIDGNVIAALETEITGKTDWQELYIINESGADTIVKSMRLIFTLSGRAFDMWLDDFEIFTPESGELPAVVTDTIQETMEVKAGNNHETVTLEQHFSIPKDCSGSDGYIVINRSIKYNTRVRLIIYTANGNSTEFDSGYSDSSDTSLRTVVALSDIGLTDEDLACIIGYQVKFNTSTSVPKLNFSITVPKPPIVTNTIQSARHVVAGNNHATVIIEENFSTPLNCSGSDGYILIKRSIKYNTRIRLILYTANGNSLQFDSGYCDISDTTLTTVVPLADLGLTDDDLANITGYDVRLNTSTSVPEIDFSIFVPKPGENIDDF